MHYDFGCLDFCSILVDSCIHCIERFITVLYSTLNSGNKESYQEMYLYDSSREKRHYHWLVGLLIAHLDEIIFNNDPLYWIAGLEVLDSDEMTGFTTSTVDEKGMHILIQCSVLCMVFTQTVSAGGKEEAACKKEWALTYRICEMIWMGRYFAALCKLSS